MATQAIAKTAVQFTADTSDLNRGIAAAENRLHTFSKETGEKFDKFSEKGKKALNGLAGKAGAVGGALEGLEGLGGLAALAAEFGGVAAIIAGIGIAGSKAMQHFQEELDKAKKAGEELDAKIRDRNQQRFDSKLGDNNAIPNTLQRALSLSQQYKDVNKEVLGIEAQKSKILKEQEAFEKNTTASFLKRNLGIITTTKGADRDFESELKAVNVRLAQAHDNQDKVRDAWKEIRKSATLSISTQIENLRVQNATFGMTAEAVERYKASLTGVDKGLLKIAAAEEARLKKKQDAAEIKKGVEDLTKSLREQVATWGMAAEQVSIYQMRTKGATQAQLAQAIRSANVIAALREHDELLEKRKDAMEKLKDFKPQAGEKSSDLQAVASMSAEATNALTRAKADFALQRDADKRNQDEQKKQTELLRSIDERLKKVDLIIKGGGR